ncbi:MAG: hypothetical protein ACK5CE_15820 [Actinomycetes bacterium]|uniref:Unannotated protein n=1 Tax=freshwater metagenome TaxID=449393 RepID=A0A6J6C057_9ZZZZ|nr:hypothetical protein [Actinomycetota bacterium]
MAGACSVTLRTTPATGDGRTTSIRAVVQHRPDSGELAVNSWRVSNRP